MKNHEEVNPNLISVRYVDISSTETSVMLGQLASERFFRRVQFFTTRRIQLSFTCLQPRRSRVSTRPSVVDSCDIQESVI